MGSPADVGARALRSGELVVHPTDTLYALAARAEDPRAVERLVAAKGRAPDRPLSVAVSSVEELEAWVSWGPGARRFVRDELPGPYTVLARPSRLARVRLARSVVGRRTIGLRVPDHPLARELARRAGPIVATSANRSGSPAARTLAQARSIFGREVRAYLDELPRPTGVPSSLIDVTGSTPRPVRRR